MLTIWGFVSGWGIPDISPFCLKLATALRLGGVAHRYRNGLPQQSPTGKLPCAELSDGTRVPDSSQILQALRERGVLDLDEGLAEDDRVRAPLLVRAVEEGLYFSLLSARWLDEAGFAATRVEAFREVPAPIRFVAARAVRRTVKKTLHGQGYGRLSLDEVARRGVEDLVAVEAHLPRDGFFFGDRPRAIDATLFAFGENLRKTPVSHPLYETARALPKWNALCDRVSALAWPSFADDGERDFRVDEGPSGTERLYSQGPSG